MMKTVLINNVVFETSKPFPTGEMLFGETSSFPQAPHRTGLNHREKLFFVKLYHPTLEIVSGERALNYVIMQRHH